MPSLIHSNLPSNRLDWGQNSSQLTRISESYVLANGADFLGEPAPNGEARQRCNTMQSIGRLTGAELATHEGLDARSAGPRTALATSPSPMRSPTTSRRDGSRPATGCRRSATLAARLSLDFTTVARGYVEAGKRGLVEFDRGPRHVRPPQRDGARRAGPRPLAGGLLDEHAAGAGRPRYHRAHARRLGQRERRPRIAVCATKASAARRAIVTRRQPGSDGARWCPRRSASFVARRAWRDGRHLQPARQGGRSDPVRER